MRIICPNCEAQYEVDSGLVPEGGRDVQCSACSHTWMQFADGRVEVIADETAPAPSSSEEAEDEDEEEPTGGPAPVPAQRRELASEARKILREEAQREADRRRARRVTGMETQPDQRLEDQPPKQRAPEPSLENVPAGAEAGPAVGVTAKAPPARRRRGGVGVFPDIEEINSTLAASDAEDDDHDESTGRRGRGAFRTGFLLMLSVAIVIMALYLAAPQLAVRVPAIEPEVAAYVSAVNSFRMAVEGVLEEAAQWIEGLSA